MMHRMFQERLPWPRQPQAGAFLRGVGNPEEVAEPKRPIYGLSRHARTPVVSRRDELVREHRSCINS